MYELGTAENPITSKEIDADRGYKFCKCDYCQIVAECVPDFDFYRQPDKTLKCQQCLVDGCKAQGISPLGFGPDRGRS
jgi:hypothetical protein